MATIHSLGSVLALDVGSKRIGIAVASLEAKLPHPLITLDYDEDTFWPGLENIVEVESVKGLIIGFPRGQQGQTTAQTEAIEAFATQLKQHFPLPIYFQDESLTSQHAEAELRARGHPFDKGAVDALAATYILEDWLREKQQAVKNAEL